MKKMLAAVFMSCALLSAGALPAFANTGYDESVMNRAEDIYYSDKEGFGFYWIDSMHNSGTWHTVEGNMSGDAKVKIKVEPYIVLSRKKDCEEFDIRVITDSSSGTEMNIDGVCIRIGNTNYVNSREFTDHFFFKLGSLDSKIQEYNDGSQWVREYRFIYLNRDSYHLLDDLAAHQNELMHIFVRLKDSDKWISCYSLKQNEMDSFVHLYNLYKEAGGTREENLKAIKDTASTYQYTDYSNGT